MFQLNLKNTVLRSILKFHNDRLTTAQVIVDTMLQNQFFGYNLATDYWIPSIFELGLKNSMIRIYSKFH
jgi:hypothetical protein